MSINLILIGPPGVGKGTQASLVVERLGLVHLASGDIFRNEISNETELGLWAQSFIERGELVPDEITIGMMDARISADDVSRSGFVLDGFPRTVAQAVALDELLGRLGVIVDRVISLEVEDDDVVERISGRRLCPNCGELYHVTNKPPKIDEACDVCDTKLVVREDDNPDTIRQRLEVFHKTTQPVIEHYASSGALFRVQGIGSIEEVYAAMTEGFSQ